MTHDTNCQVKDEWRERVTEIGRRYWDGDKQDAEIMARDLGWEKIGGGAGRQVWRVPTDQQAGERGGPVKDSPCVIKFGTQGHHWNGKRQNRNEISQWKQLPQRVKDHEPPVFVPLKDWDDRSDLWVTMPEVDPGGGFHIEDRLAEVGLDCPDMHGDNIGEIHGAPVILDYGIQCTEVDEASEQAEDVASWLERSEYAHGIDWGGDTNDAWVEFSPPDWIGVEGLPKEPSSVGIDRITGIDHIILRFGPFEGEHVAGAFHEVEERLGEDWYDVWMDVRVDPREDDVYDVALSAEIEAHHPDERWVPDMVRDFYDDAIHFIEEYVDAAADPSEFLQDVAHEMDDTGITEFERDTEGADAVLKFWPPKDAPGFERPSEPSRIRVDTLGFDELIYRVGPWQADERLYPPLPDGADLVTESVQDQYPDQHVRWELPNVGGDTREVSFIVSTDDDDPDSVDLDPGDVQNLFVFLAVEVSREMPVALGPGAGTQQPLDEFSLEIENAAAAGAVADGGASSPETVVAGSIQGAISLGMLDDKAQQQAEGFAAALWEHVHGDGEMGPQRVNVLVAEIASRHYDGPGEIQTNADASRVVLVREGESIRHWGFWVGIEAAAEHAPEAQDKFIEEVSATVLGSVEEVIRESRSAT